MCSLRLSDPFVSDCSSRLHPWSSAPRALGRVYKLIYLWQRKAVFRAHLVQICIVETHVLLFIGLFYHHNISKPRRILFFSDDAGLEEFLDLFLDGGHLLIGEMPPFSGTRALPCYWLSVGRWWPQGGYRAFLSVPIRIHRCSSTKILLICFWGRWVVKHRF